MASTELTSINYLAPVQDALVQVEERMRAQADENHIELKSALDHLLSSGGKRVRPAVALLTGGMLGANHDALVNLAAAIELLHTATLVHDDLIDSSLLRRGIATLNSRWSPAATVLTGDFIFARAAQLAAATNSVQVMNMFAQTLATIVSGELTQLFTSRGLASRENYQQRIYAKTASMFELATAAPAMLSPAGAQTIETARRFGYNIGMAFQIVDDILDFTGEQETVGKPVASDLRQGLITLPALYYLEAQPEDVDMLRILEGNSYNDGRLNRLVAAIRESGAIEQSMEEARSYVERGLKDLEQLPPGVEHDALEDLSKYIVRRDL